MTSARTMRPRLAPSDARIAVFLARGPLRDHQDGDVRAGDQERQQHGGAQHPRQRERHALAERRPFEAGHFQAQLPLGGRQMAGVLLQAALQSSRKPLRRDAGLAPDHDVETGLRRNGGVIERRPDRRIIAENQKRSGITPTTTCG
ncbi:MAG: hypothetical protein DMF94_01955 [Acidobacteria bacterium]|nr:MAG: hypothetical protein DMF94_01955 [Acidobacteriota bacterium]